MKIFEIYNNSRAIYSLEILSTAKNKEALIQLLIKLQTDGIHIYVTGIQCSTCKIWHLY